MTLPDFTLSVPFLCPRAVFAAVGRTLGMMEVLAGSVAAPTIRLKFRVGPAGTRGEDAKR